jgi:hypothetical protein
LANPPEKEIDFHLGVDYAKFRRIVREEIELAITNLFKAAELAAKNQNK